MDYSQFIERKRRADMPTGFVVSDLGPSLFPFQRDIVRWALRRGRAACFADCGLGKTIMQLEWARHIPGDVLILAPLAVAEQTREEGTKFGIAVKVCRTQADVVPGINITNYEMLQHFDPARFAGIVLDESAILKDYTSATRNAIIGSFGRTPYRLACTATPAPNDYMELGNHAEFLGVMSRVEMLSMFFVHDGGETQQWRLKGHAEDAFWRWVASWAVMLRFPSDLGYEDGGFVLPDIKYHEHLVEADPIGAGVLFDYAPASLIDRRRARKASISGRVEKAAEMVAQKPGEQWLIWCDLNAEQDALEEMFGPERCVSIRGADSHEDKLARNRLWLDGGAQILISKPSIFGHGMNWQHCCNMTFVGLSDSYEALYQAVRRCWRFGQTRSVSVHIITATTEGAVLHNVRRKEGDAEAMASVMVQHMKEINRMELQGNEPPKDAIAKDVTSGELWTMHRGDCVEVLRTLDADTVGYSVFSPPFASLYTYSNSECDMGNCANSKEFLEHFEFCVRELYRVTMPGRLLSFHCMNLPTSKVRDGVIGLQDFRGDLIRAFQSAGFIYHSEVCIWKDPVTAMQRTKALGLLHKQLKKDSCMSRQGIADYLVTMRKPGDNPRRVTHTNESFPVVEWQEYASPIWTDINPSDTLQASSAREEKDERHIAPLQLEVIRRALRMWSREGDLVLSPFAGIGSEGYEAIRSGRRFVGIELKRSYYDQACSNLARAQLESKQSSLFEAAQVAETEWPR